MCRTTQRVPSSAAAVPPRGADVAHAPRVPRQRPGAARPLLMMAHVVWCGRLEWRCWPLACWQQQAAPVCRGSRVSRCQHVALRVCVCVCVCVRALLLLPRWLPSVARAAVRVRSVACTAGAPGLADDAGDHTKTRKHDTADGGHARAPCALLPPVLPGREASSGAPVAPGCRGLAARLRC
jgi:hypothetical protein